MLIAENILDHQPGLTDDPMVQLEELFNRLDVMKDSASTEGLVSIVKRITVALSDYMIKIMANIKSNVTGIFKSIKRSELEAYLQSKHLAYKVFKKANYSTVYKAKSPYFPFNKNPSQVANFCNDTFKSYNMQMRLRDITKNYYDFCSAVQHNDASKASVLLDTISNLNMSQVVSSTMSVIKDMVLVRLPKKYSTFGATFSSVDEMTKAVDLTLKSKGEFNNSVKTVNMLRDLYKAFDKINLTLSNVDAKKIDILKLRRVVEVIRDTGSLIDSYGVVVREAHHLDHNLVNTLTTAIDKAKQAL